MRLPYLNSDYQQFPIRGVVVSRVPFNPTYQSHSVFGFLNASSGIGVRRYPHKSGLQTPPTRVIRDN